jgi:protein-L-isoaspartate(D-aspartate) O-methyltransferase
MRSVPRQLFVPPTYEADAYLDAPLPIGWGQTISQPYMVALMTALLGADVRSRVLEIGAGSGYQTAVLAEVAGEVYALERLAPLAEGARAVLARLAYQNVRLAIADGTRGWPEAAPFGGILAAAAADAPPPALLEQLAVGGRLVIPIGRRHGDQVLTVYEREADGVSERHDTHCRFVPLVADEAGAPGGGTAAPGRPPGGEGATAARSREQSEEGVLMKAVRVTVHGRVQGVYYRASARAEGARLGLRGWAKNMSDGTVALHLQGDPAFVDTMLDWCRSGPPAAQVGRLEVTDAEPDGTLHGFEVR